METTFIFDDRELQAMLKRAAAKLGGLTTLMNKIGQEYEKSVLDNFAKQASPDGIPWKQLSAATMTAGIMKRGGLTKRGPVRLKKKAQKWVAGKRILIAAGDLEQSIHYQAFSDRVVIGTGGQIPYARIHQKGGPAGRKSKRIMLPARPYLAENDGEGLKLGRKDAEMVTRLIREYVDKAFK